MQLQNFPILILRFQKLFHYFFPSQRTRIIPMNKKHFGSINILNIPTLPIPNLLTRTKIVIFRLKQSVQLKKLPLDFVSHF